MVLRFPEIVKKKKTCQKGFQNAPNGILSKFSKFKLEMGFSAHYKTAQPLSPLHFKIPTYRIEHYILLNLFFLYNKKINLFSNQLFALVRTVPLRVLRFCCLFVLLIAQVPF